MNRLIVVIFALLIYSCNENHLINNRQYKAEISEMLIKQKKLVQNREKQLFEVFNSKLHTDEKEALEFLYAFMPLNDLADYSGVFFLSQVRTTLKARKELSWIKNIPEDIYLNFVLPLRVNNENLDSFRSAMYEEIKSRVKNLSMKQAALEVNHWCHEKVNYRPTDSRTSSPLSTMQTSWGRCGEESVFTVAAMRTVGIPARQVYTPRWAHTNDNHAWVEVWIDGKWNFLGACEPEADLNIAWFTEPARRAMLVHTRAYGCYFGNEIVITSNERFSELNLIANYAPVKQFSIKVIDDSNRPVENAKIEFRLFNYCEFYPLAKTFSDKQGMAKFTTGLGDLLIWVSKENEYGFRKISVDKTDEIKVQISEKHPENYSTDFDLVPPVQPVPFVVDEKGKKENDVRLKIEDSIRTKYNSTFKDSVWTAKFAQSINLPIDSVWKILKKVYGNWKEISEFLNHTEINYKKWALKMLYKISDKDLRDTKASVLNNHLTNSFSLIQNQKNHSDDFFAEYILSPRIGNELLRPWRSFLQNKFEKQFTNALEIIDWIKNTIILDEEANLLSRCPLSPQGVYELKVADKHSRNIFFVALCRSFGIPARLNPVNSVPQYYSEKTWKDAVFESVVDKPSKRGFVHFVNSTKEMVPKYMNTFTIAKFEKGVFETLEFEEDLPLDKFASKVEVDAGKYMLVTGNRIAGGSVLSSIKYFEVKENEVTNLDVKVRTFDLKPIKLGELDTKNIALSGYFDNKPIELEKISKGKKTIYLWLNTDQEPTRHILADLPAVTEQFNDWNGNIIFILSKTNTNFNQANYRKMPLQTIYAFDTDNKLLSQIETIKKRKLHQSYPVIIVCDADNNIIFYSEGYTIGIGEQLIKIVK